MKKIIIIAIIFLILSACGAFWEFSKKAHPTKRQVIASPIYTIGDKSYGLALKNNKTVVKFGPMFMGIYPGGLAFSKPAEAMKYLIDNNWDIEKWDIYQLSGDFGMDVTNGHINKSLLVLTKKQLTNQPFQRESRGGE